MIQNLSNKKPIIFTLLLLQIILISLTAQSKELKSRYKYTDLMIKNYNEVKEFVDQQVQKSSAILKNQTSGKSLDARESEAVQVLTKTLRYIFSRPDKDNMVQRVLPPVRQKLKNLYSYSDTLEKLSNECIFNIKNNKLAPVHTATCVFILENIMSEIKPRVKRSKSYRKILTKIKESELEVPRKVRSFRRMRGMFNTPSLSETAENILNK